MHVGDIFAWKALPYVDPSAGGSVVEQPRTLARAVSAVKNVDTIINGHIPVATWNDLRDYADFTRDFVAHAEASIKAGKSVDQAAAEFRIAPKYKGYIMTVAEGFVTPKGNLQLAYDELTRK